MTATPAPTPARYTILRQLSDDTVSLHDVMSAHDIIAPGGHVALGDDDTVAIVTAPNGTEATVPVRHALELLTNAGQRATLRPTLPGA